MEHSLSDEELMMNYRHGDICAFEELYKRHKGPLYRYIVRQVGDAGPGDEIFQDTWMKLIQARKRYEPKAKFTTYLYHIAHNRVIDHYRKSQRGTPVSYDETLDMLQLDEAANENDPLQITDIQRQLQQLDMIVGKLPEAQREVFLLRQQAGMSLDEIAEATGVERETAKSRLRYALAKIRKSFGENQ